MLIMIKSLVLLVLSTIFGVSSFAQCGKEYDYICNEELEGDHYTPLLTKKIDNHEGDDEKIEYAYQFTKGMSYEFYFDGEMDGDSPLEVSLYNFNHDLVLASNQHDAHKIIFKCTHSGIYYITFSFENHDSFCGTVGLGYVSN